MTIAAVTCVRDESDIIEEWLAHHLTLGIERIHIFDNGSQDGTWEKIERIAAKVPGITFQTWGDLGGGHRNVAAFDAGLDLMRAEGVDWCAFLDADEFILNGTSDGSDPRARESFAEFLTRNADNHAIGLNWAIFGSAGHHRKPGGLTQEAFLRRAEDGFSVNRHIKSVVRPRSMKRVLHSHGFLTEHAYVNAKQEEIVWRTAETGGPPVSVAFTDNFPVLDGWRVNHYFCRWRARWDEKVKLAILGGGFPRSELDWQHHDRNEVFDDTALRLTPATRARMQSWEEQVRSAG